VVANQKNHRSVIKNGAPV